MLPRKAWEEVWIAAAGNPTAKCSLQIQLAGRIDPLCFSAGLWLESTGLLCSAQLPPLKHNCSPRDFGYTDFKQSNKNKECNCWSAFNGEDAVFIFILTNESLLSYCYSKGISKISTSSLTKLFFFFPLKGIKTKLEKKKKQKKIKANKHRNQYGTCQMQNRRGQLPPIPTNPVLSGCPCVQLWHP